MLQIFTETREWLRVCSNHYFTEQALTATILARSSHEATGAIYQSFNRQFPHPFPYLYDIPVLNMINFLDQNSTSTVGSSVLYAQPSIDSYSECVFYNVS